eukprot:GHVL01014659.1.p1 GENE.GHVL01014659.1~~GHVL01014659.1.p1  ORF type:complete len:134 (+),score=24.57 GHVL01014659.1:170-571(+)
MTPIGAEKIQVYALMAALKDSRFSPVTIEEISHLSCTVSILYNFQKCQSPYDWTIGVHGIKIYFNIENSEYSATYLPEVAFEHNLSQIEALRQLIQKSGYKNCFTEDLIDKLVVERYQSIKKTITYKEYTNMI